MPNGTARTGRTTNELCSLNGQSDEALIKAIAAGNQAAMRILYARHNVRVYRFIARMVGDAGRAEDLVSEVFIDVWSQADRFDRVRRLRPGSCRSHASRRCRLCTGAGMPNSTKPPCN